MRPVLACVLMILLLMRVATAAAPMFTEPVALVRWLIEHSGRGFDYQDNMASARVFTPGLRAALRASFERSRNRNEPPCGADGDVILDTQEVGEVQDLRLSAWRAGRNRVTVSASFEVSGAHRDRRFQTVRLGGVWKLEDVTGADGASLRRSLACR